jgi:hypothetical protein
MLAANPIECVEQAKQVLEMGRGALACQLISLEL